MLKIIHILLLDVTYNEKTRELTEFHVIIIDVFVY